MSTTPSPSEIKEVEMLLIEADNTGGKAASFSGERLSACIRIGQKLNEWKSMIPRGSWNDWLEQHFPDQLPESTRLRWMRLAKLAKDEKLKVETARGLRHAYQLAGLLPDPDSTATKGGSGTESYVVYLARLVAALQHIDIAKLDVRQRNEIKNRLAPVVVFIGKLA